MTSIGAKYIIELLQTTDKQKPWLQQLKYVYLHPTPSLPPLFRDSKDTWETLEKDSQWDVI